MNKSFLIFLFTVSLVGIFFFGCAKETPRTDVTLELTSPDTIEALVEKDLNTIGTSYQDIDNFPESTPAQVTYVDSVEMQKPLRVQNDDSLYKGEESIDDYALTTSNVSLWGPDGDKALEPLNPRETVPVIPPPSGNVTPVGELNSSTVTPPVGTSVTTTTASSSMLQPKPATETSAVTAPNVGYAYQGNQSSQGTSGGYVGTSAVTSGNTYTVQAGDSLIKIARKFGVKVSDLCAVNGISRSQILKVGQVLQIPGEKAAVSNEPAQTKEVGASISSVVQPAQTQQAAAPAAAGTQNYTVQAGDSYWKLARRFNSSVEELMSMNGASSDKLRIGQTIIVPNR
ncbi:LysM peptidoglycan-binding domain-containing protein [bacterium]|nr:LysM peptidoglycan-binding domain-containing protein [bacterium]